MGWIKTNYDFGLPCKVFVVSVRQVSVACRLRDTMRDMTPEDIEKTVLDMITLFRPNLKGGSVMAIDFRPGQLQFEIVYVHPSLPKVNTMGWNPQHENLDPNYHEIKLGHTRVEDEPIITREG